MMRKQKQRALIFALLLTVLMSAASVFGQEPASKPKPEGDVVIFERHVGPPALPGDVPRIQVLPDKIPGPDETFIFLSTEMSFGRRVVKNAPYSAQATTETIQVLGDGNRIVRKNSSNVYRDSEGRTRHDQSLGSIGPWATAGEPRQTSFINDPVSRTHYVLEPRSRTARKLTLPPPPPPPGRPGDGDAKVKHEMKIRVVTPPNIPAGKPGSIMDDGLDNDISNEVDVAIHADSLLRMARDKKTRDNLRKESLGKQMIEGVEAEGTRETFTIPAGEIGNEQPIQVVSERWFSPELQTLVLSRHTDPRFGETIFRLTGINRSEPARSLFEVPADHTVKDGPVHARTFRKKIGEPK